MKIPIIYEDTSLFAINKPAGISVHKTHEHDPNETVADILLAEHSYLKDVGEDALRPGIVHRLDKGTSGVMVIAKTQAAFNHLKKQFQDRLTKKEYLALVYGRVKNTSGSIDLPLGKVGTRQTTQIQGKRQLVVRDAHTDYSVERQFADYALLRVRPLTGRTHQIRVHLKAIGHPIAGDREYASKKPYPNGLERMFLHAEKLQITSPEGILLTLEAPLPGGLQKVLDSLQ